MSCPVRTFLRGSAWSLERVKDGFGDPSRVHRRVTGVTSDVESFPIQEIQVFRHHSRDYWYIQVISRLVVLGESQ